MLVSDMTQAEVREQTTTVPSPSPDDASRTPPRRRWLLAALLVLVAIGVLVTGIRSRMKDETALKAVTAQMAVPSVSVVLPKQSAPAQELILPGNIQPFISSPVYARTDGYLKKWYFDIGAHVKAGDLLAVIETPEVDEQLAQARYLLENSIKLPIMVKPLRARQKTTPQASA